MLTLNQIISQITDLANAHYQIAEVGTGTLAELQSKPDRLYPLLWLSNEGGSLDQNYKIDNIRLTMFGRVIAGEEGQDDDASELEVLSDMQLILLDFLNYFHQQHGQEYVTDKAATLEHFTERTNDRTAGYSCVLELKQFYDWNKCQIPQSGASIPPSVDGLTLYDFCDQAVIDRLTATQVACLQSELCGACADATVQLNGTTVGTIPSGDSDSFTVNLDGSPSGSWDGTAWQVTSAPCDDATIELNGVEMTTIPSGDTENISVRQSSGATEVGSKQGVHWRIDDSAISINGSPVADVKAEDSLDIDVTQGGSPVGSWNGSAWIVPPCTSIPSLSINVYSDAGLTNPITTADFGDTVYIHVTPTDITPVNYVYSIDCVTGTMIDTSASATYAFTIASYDPITIYVQAKDATNATAAFNEFSLTVNEDAQSLAFIAAHNTASGATMAALQQSTVKGFVRLLRGVGTPYESDLLTYYQGFSDARMWIQAPVSDAVVSVAGYELDLIHLATGAYVNFVSGDFATTGVTGGTTKYFASGVSPSDFDQNSLYVGQYIRDEATGTRLVCGSSQAANFNNSTFMQCTGDNNNFANINGSGIITFGIVYVGKSLGLCGVNRPSSSFYELKYSDKVLLPTTLTSNTPSTNEMYFHAMNYGGSANFYFNKEVCMYMILPSMTHEQLDDLKYAVQWYNANIITGGRDV